MIYESVLFRIQSPLIAEKWLLEMGVIDTVQVIQWDFENIIIVWQHLSDMEDTAYLKRDCNCLLISSKNQLLF